MNTERSVDRTKRKIWGVYDATPGMRETILMHDDKTAVIILEEKNCIITATSIGR